MARPIVTDLFLEDRAHEEFISAVVLRLASEGGWEPELHFRSVVGGHGKAVAELESYQQKVRQRGLGLSFPDLLIIGIDANCKPYPTARTEIQNAVADDFKHLAVIACPEPHIERWYMADPTGFHSVVGAFPRPGKRKCERDRYKMILSRAVEQGGHPPMLGGIEFARELVEAMDFYRAGRAERSLKAFLEDLSARLRIVGSLAS